MDLLPVLASSSIIAAAVSGLVGLLVQRSMANKQAKLGYEYEARRRLREAIGPLRFQLLFACRDVERRLTGHLRGSRWNLDTAAYYGHSTLFRLLRPLAICTLIQRQMNATDFSVDPSGVELLKFEIAAYRMLTSRDPLPDLDRLDWSRETQHVFGDNLRRAALRLVAKDDGGQSYIMDIAEFADRFPTPLTDEALAPLARIIEECGHDLATNSVFWTRLVGYAYLCAGFVGVHGPTLGFTPHPVDVTAMVGRATDPDIRSRARQQEAVFSAIVNSSL